MERERPRLRESIAQPPRATRMVRSESQPSAAEDKDFCPLNVVAIRLSPLVGGWDRVNTVCLRGLLRGLLLVFILLASSAFSVAQHREPPRAGSQSAPLEVPNPDDYKDFRRAIELEATPDQAIRFQKLIRSILSSRKYALDFLQMGGNATKVDLFHGAHPLTDAVEEAQAQHEQFVNSFSDVQKSGLKELAKRIGKINAELTKQDMALGQQLDRSNPDAKQMVGIVEKLDKVLRDYETQYRVVGARMGLPGEGSLQ